MQQEIDYGKLGTRIKETRQSRGLTQENLAEIVGCNTSHISNIEGGRAHPSLSALVKIANILECSVDFFIGGEYFYKIDKSIAMTLDEKIIDKLKYCDIDKKRRVLQMIDLL